MVKKLAFILTVFLLFFSSCTQKEWVSTENNQAYHMPSVDLYVVRGAGAFNVTSGETAAGFLQRCFGEGQESLHSYMTQMNIAFYHSKIRIFYILEPTDTGADSFTLTNEDGTTSKGTVYVNPDNMKIFFLDVNPTSSNIAGLATLGNENLLKNYRHLMYIKMYSQGTSNHKGISKVLAHEMGHYFGLPHPFSDKEGDNGMNPNSCSPAKQGSTNHIMDYTSRPEIFTDCESLIGSYLAGVFTNGEKKLYFSGEGGNHVELYTGNWNGVRTIGSPWRNTRSLADDKVKVTVID